MSPSQSGSEGALLSNRIEITDSSLVGEARRKFVHVAQSLRLNEITTGKLAIIATELGNNLVRHALKGELVIRRLRSTGCPGVEVLSIDRGPGMVDISTCLQDGFTSGTTPGTGLGAVKRLSDTFDIYSKPGQGTVVLASVLEDSTASDHHISKNMEFGAVCLPLEGESLCGDAWAHLVQITGDAVMVADGLGHGPLASRASAEALKVFCEGDWKRPTEMIAQAHAQLRSTRGAAVSVAVADTIGGVIHFVGVGNVRGVLIQDGVIRTLTAFNGTVGLQARTVREVDEPWKKGSLLVMHSDGISSKWDLAQYPGIVQRHPSILAAVLYRDWSRKNDDVCVFVGKCLV